MRGIDSWLKQAVAQQIISQEQAVALQALPFDAKESSRLNLSHVLAYVGGFIAISALFVFLQLAWQALASMGLVLMALLYLALGIGVLRYSAHKGLWHLASIAANFVVLVTPLLLFGLLHWLSLWPLAQEPQAGTTPWYWPSHSFVLLLDVAALAVGAVLFWRYRFSFSVLPLLLTFSLFSWQLSALLWPALLHDDDFLMQLILVLGGGYCVLALWVDSRFSPRADYAFWLYLVGALQCWLACTVLFTGTEFTRVWYALFSFVFLGVGAVLGRVVFVVCGALGLSGYLCYLAWDLFSGSWLFPVALTLFGALLVFLGLWWQKNQSSFSKRLRQCLPKTVQAWLPH